MENNLTNTVEEINPSSIYMGPFYEGSLYQPYEVVKEPERRGILAPFYTEQV